MRVPLERYLRGGTKIYSLVAAVPFSPIDIDLGLLARGEWNPLKDRFRVWYLPKTRGGEHGSTCYLMIRKVDARSEVLVYMHIVVNLKSEEGDGQAHFTLGILSNDDIRARSILSTILGIPPIFHRRSEIRLIESKWRDDPRTVMRFTANVCSALAADPRPGEQVYSLRVQPPRDFLTTFRSNLDAWWDASSSATDEPAEPAESENGEASSPEDGNLI